MHFFSTQDAKLSSLVVKCGLNYRCVFVSVVKLLVINLCKDSYMLRFTGKCADSDGYKGTEKCRECYCLFSVVR